MIQEVYRRYGKHGAAMTANVITYRGRSAMREIGKALNFPPDVLDRFSRLFANGDFPHTLELAGAARAGRAFRRSIRAPPAAVALYQQIYGLPRHLGQHSRRHDHLPGATRAAVVPLENASMPGRVVAQWDKDDCEDLGIIKVDLLGLGMMAVLQDTIELCAAARTQPVDLAKIPKDDPATYDMMRARGHDRRFPNREPRADGDAAAHEAANAFTISSSKSRSSGPGPIQGGHDASVSRAAHADRKTVTYYPT